MTDDAELLRGYAQERDESAFGELVQRHVNLVYGVALRRLGGDAHGAADVTQQVFTALARRAPSLSGRVLLPGWLYGAARNLSADFVRSEHARRAREQEAHTMHELDSNPSAAAKWDEVRPMLDNMIDELSARDREAVVLRFFAQRSFAQIGAALNVSEDAARMRLERALDKLHALLARRGVTSTSAALAAILANQAAATAPAGLAASVAGAALSGMAVNGAGALAALIASMSASKVSMSVAAAGALAVATAVYQSVQAHAATARLADAHSEHRALVARFANLETSVSAAEKERAEHEAALERRRAEKAVAVATPASAAPVDDINAKYREIVNRLAQNDPELPKAQAMHRRLKMMEGYRPLFAGLGFTPEQIERAVDILETPGKPVAQAQAEFRAAFGETTGNRLAEFSSDGG
ncbi:MAG: sigma-70 family RNA polymerase sigma factor [Opitutaceae bacterium]|nr:sigma-70 family RNA polymerase sigma factor [Opitutaceae bacterium]